MIGCYFGDTHACICLLLPFANSSGHQAEAPFGLKSMGRRVTVHLSSPQVLCILILAPPCTMSNPSSTHHSQIGHVPPEITAHPDDLEVASKSLSQGKKAEGEKAVLQVIDAPYDGSTPQVLKVFSLSDDIASLGDDIAEGMKSLPPHGSGTARILDVTTHSDFVITGLRDTKGPERTRPARDVLIKFLQDTYTQPFEERRIFRWLNDPLLVNDIGSISSQWSQRLGGGNTNFYRLVNRTSLEQDPSDYDLHPRDSYMTCAQDADGRLIGECILLFRLLLLTSLQPS